jgi:hypothetical protein
MFALLLVLVIWGGFDTRPSPWVMQQGTFGDQAACTAAATAIAASPAIRQPLPQAPQGMVTEIGALCVQTSTPRGGTAAITHTARRRFGPPQ